MHPRENQIFILVKLKHACQTENSNLHTTEEACTGTSRGQPSHALSHTSVNINENISMPRDWLK
jgi:hypothetical protein